MDHMMPKMDGIETTKKIREMGYAQPIVALTANAIIGQSNIFMENGFDGFISKPIDIRQLNTVLKKFVRDKQPPEVIEAANRDKGNQATSITVQNTEAGINPKLAEIFARDATKLADTLKEIQEKGSYSEEDIRTYTISTHALKSALTNVREIDLSNISAMLEDAGRTKDTAMMATETFTFLDKLRAVIKKHTPRKEDDAADEAVAENITYLREKLQVIKNACEVYDRKTIKGALTDLQQKEWSNVTKKLLATMEEELLNGDFEALSKVASEGTGKNENNR
jgi:CheY-like chemotaxis protein